MPASLLITGSVELPESFLAMSEATVPAIEVHNLTKRFGVGASAVHALAGVSLRVAPGEFFGLLGPNGAGKTTLISMVAGLTRSRSEGVV